MSRGRLDPIGGRSPYPHAVCVERETRPVCVHGYVMDTGRGHLLDPEPTEARTT